MSQRHQRFRCVVVDCRVTERDEPLFACRFHPALIFCEQHRDYHELHASLGCVCFPFELPRLPKPLRQPRQPIPTASDWADRLRADRLRRPDR